MPYPYRYAEIVWDDSKNGNAEHIAEHGLEKDEVEEVLRDRNSKRAKSRSSNKPIVFGYTKAGKFIAVVIEDLGGNPRVIYPITAYETDP
jgi:uncharacterized DUF497 family protein